MGEVNNCTHCGANGNVQLCSSVPCMMRESFYVRLLEKALFDLIDAHVGTDLHDLGNGDGLNKEEADEIRCLYTNMNKESFR